MAVIDSAELLLQAKNYSGSGDWLDETANGHDAVPTASPSFDGTKFSLNGSSQYFTVADHANLDFAAAESFTVMVWAMRPTGATGTDVLLNKKNDTNFPGGTAGYGLYSYDPTNIVGGFSDATIGEVKQATVTGSTPYVVAYRRDVAGDDQCIFIDGTESGAPDPDGTTATLANANVLRIGAVGNATPSSFWEGDIYAVVVWRSALSDADIATAGDELTATADRYLLESGTDGYLLEDSSGVLLLEGADDQTLTGSLFSRTPSFPVGAATPVNTLTGVLLTVTPTFGAGAVSALNTITGVLFTRTASFPAGAVTGLNTLDGVLFTVPPTFGVGTLTGFTPLAGVLFSTAPTFPVGAVTAEQTAAGVLFSRAPTFGVGRVDLVIVGIVYDDEYSEWYDDVFSVHPVFETGSAGAAPVTLTGVLFSQAPTFGVGTATVGPGIQTLTGTLYVRAPSFPVGAVLPQPVTLTGVLFSRTPGFGVGAVTVGAVTLNGVLLTVAPVFPAGVLAQGQVVSGVLFSRSPSFPAGAAQPQPVTLTGILFTVAPVFGAGRVDQAVVGVVYVRNPASPDGAVLAAGQVAGVLFTVIPVFGQGHVNRPRMEGHGSRRPAISLEGAGVGGPRLEGAGVGGSRFEGS